MTDAFNPGWESFFANFVPNRGQRFLEMTGFKPQLSDQQSYMPWPLSQGKPITHVQSWDPDDYPKFKITIGFWQ